MKRSDVLILVVAVIALLAVPHSLDAQTCPVAGATAQFCDPEFADCEGGGTCRQVLDNNLLPDGCICASGTNDFFIVSSRQTPQEKAAQQEFMGVNWGMGFGATIDLEGGTRIEAAEAVNGLVRITKETNQVPRIFLELHNFVRSWDFDKGRKVGLGPFVAIQSSKDEILDSIALGVMVGAQRKAGSSTSFNVGVGILIDRAVTVLGDGMVANMPLPMGEEEIRLKEESRYAVAVITSFSF